MTIKLFVLILFITTFCGSAFAESYFYAGNQLLGIKNDEECMYQYQNRLGTDIESTTLPFGQIIQSQSRFSFTGKEEDKSELHYFGARYLDTHTGRFTSVDPVHDGNDYAYVNNDPLNKIDPTGTFGIAPGSEDFSAEFTANHYTTHLNDLAQAPLFDATPVDDGYAFTVDYDVLKNIDSDDIALSIIYMFVEIVENEKIVNFYLNNKGENFGSAKVVTTSINRPALDDVYSGSPAQHAGPIIAHEITHSYMFLGGMASSETEAVLNEGRANTKLKELGIENPGKRAYYGTFALERKFFPDKHLKYTPEAYDEASRRAEYYLKTNNIQNYDAPRFEKLLHNILLGEVQEDMPEHFQTH